MTSGPDALPPPPGPRSARGLRRALASAFPDLDPRRVEPLGNGWHTAAWLVDGRWVFRLPRHTSDLPQLAAERHVLAAIAGRLPVRVPEPVHVAGPSRRFPLGVAGYALVEGRPLGSIPRLGPVEATRLGHDVGRFLAALHATPDRLALEARLPSLGAADIAADLERLRRQLPGWSGAPGWIAEALEQCAAELAGPLPEALVHDDLHGAHVLVDDACHLTGVIDWGEMKRGDPARDLLFFLPAGPHLLDALLNTYGQPDPGGLLRRAYWHRLHRAAAQIAEALERGLVNFLPIAEQRLQVWRRLPLA